jgi:hypothetical protein
MDGFRSTPTMHAFMQDESFVRLIAGPIGSGKSVCCSHELVRLALLQRPDAAGMRKSRTLIVRNTLDQLRSTTMKTFFDWFPPGNWGHYKASEKTFFMNMILPDKSRLYAEFMFLPLDTPDDVRKALSLEATFLWGNEWRELHPEVVDGLLMRLRRYPSMKDGGFTRSCALFDTNMPDIDTWHFNKMEEPPENWSVYVQPPAVVPFDEYVLSQTDEPDEEDGVTSANGVKFWVNPDADNLAHLDPRYYPDIIPGKSEDFVNVYLRCRYGRSLAGRPVYETTFSPDFHIADTAHTALRSETYPLIVGLDFGRTPAAVIGQRNVRGQLVILDELTSENMGIEKFLTEKLMPRLAQPDLIGCGAVMAPDPAGWQKTQVGEVSPVDVIRQRGLTVSKPLTNDPARRVEAVERMLLDHVDGKPALVINPVCTQLLKGFRYGYRYQLNKKGALSDVPDKNEFSHVHDALQYFCLVAASNPAGGASVHRRREVVTKRAVGWT